MACCADFGRVSSIARLANGFNNAVIRLLVDDWSHRFIRLIRDNSPRMSFPPSRAIHVLRYDISQIFFPRSLTQELGYTTVVTKSPDTGSVDLNRPPLTSTQRSASPKDQVIPILRVPSENHSSYSGHGASPEYEPEDPSNAAHPDSLEGNFRMHSWHPHEAETPSSESYVFDGRSRSLVRSRSEGHGTALNPYVRHLCVFPSMISVLIAVPIDSFVYSGHP